MSSVPIQQPRIQDQELLDQIQQYQGPMQQPLDPNRPRLQVQQQPFEQQSYEDIIARYLERFGQPDINAQMGPYEAPVGAGTIMGQVLADNPDMKVGQGGYSDAYNALAQQYAQRVGVDQSRLSSGTSGGINVRMGANAQALKPIERMAATHDRNQERIAANPNAGGNYAAGRSDLDAAGRQAVLADKSNAADAVARRKRRIAETAAANAAARG